MLVILIESEDRKIKCISFFLSDYILFKIINFGLCHDLGKYNGVLSLKTAYICFRLLRD